jgi:hypothetical protein
MALALKPILQMKEIPWGINGLILGIYNRTLGPTRRSLEEEEASEEILGDLVEELREGHDPVVVISKLEDPEKMAELSKKLESRPGFRERLEHQLDEDVDRFEEALWKGKVKLDLFTEEELQLPFSHLREELEGEQLDPSALEAKQAADRLIDSIRQALLEIMTSQRLQRMKVDLERVFQNWLSQRDRWAMALRAEIYWLDDIKVSENPFLIAAYVAEIRWVMKAANASIKK